MPEPIKSSGRYMAGLDGLRALAVFAVIAYHLNLAWAPGGLLGGDVFFVLSGYLITDLLVAQWNRSGRLNLKDFWLRRARRLLPALLVMLVVVAAWSTLFERAQLPPLRGDVLAAMLFVCNWWFIFHHVSRTSPALDRPPRSATSGRLQWRSSFICSGRWRSPLGFAAHCGEDGWSADPRGRAGIGACHGADLPAGRLSEPGLLRHRHPGLRSAHRSCTRPGMAESEALRHSLAPGALDS